MKKKVLAIVLSVLMLLGTFPATSLVFAAVGDTFDATVVDAITGNNVEYTFKVTSDSPAEVSLVGLKNAKSEEKLAFPSSVENGGITYAVTSIELNAFTGDNKLEEISVPGSIKTIGSSAFSNCDKLTKITFAEGLEVIKGNAFRNMDAIEKVEFPSTLKTMGMRAFSECLKLTEVKFNSNLTSYGDNPFAKCPITTMTIDAPIIPVKLLKKANTSAGTEDYLFSLTTIVFGPKVETVEPGAFLELPGLENLDITANSNFTISDGILYDKNGAPAYNFSATITNSFTVNAKAITKGFFDSIAADLTNVTTIILGKDVETIDGEAFNALPALTGFVCAEDGNCTFEDGVLYDKEWNMVYVTSGKTFPGDILSVKKFNEKPDDTDMRSGELMQNFVDDKYTFADGHKAEFLYEASVGDILGFAKFDTSVTSPAGSGGYVYQASNRKYTDMAYFAHVHAANYNQDDKSKLSDTSVTVYLFDTEYDESNAIVSRKLIDKADVTLLPLDNEKAISNKPVYMFPGETLTLGKILARAGVVHVTCSLCNYEEIKFVPAELMTVEEATSARDSKFTLSEDATSTDTIQCTFKFINNNGLNEKGNNATICMSHFRTISEGEDMVLLIIVAEPPLPTATATTITVHGTDKFVYKLDGADPVNAVDPTTDAVFDGLTPNTKYYIDVFDKEGNPVAVLPVTTLRDTFVPENFAIADDGKVDFAKGTEEGKVKPAHDTSDATIVPEYVSQSDPTVVLTDAADLKCADYCGVTFDVFAKVAQTKYYNTFKKTNIGTYTVKCTLPAEKDGGLAATCEADGYANYYKCSVCGKYHSDTTGTSVIGDADALAAWKLGDGKLDKLDHDWEVDPDTAGTASGWVWNSDYTVATVYLKCKNDETHKCTGIATVAAGTITENAEKVEATCIADGSVIYTATYVKDRAVKDDQTFTNSTETITLPMIGHDYGEPVVWEWNFDDSANPTPTAKATFQCKNNDSAEAPERVTVDAEVTCNKADCVPNGKIVYTATVNGLDEKGDPIEGTTYTDTEVRNHEPKLVEAESYETPTCKVDVYRCPFCGEGYMTITATVLDKDNKPVEGAKISINGVSVEYNVNGVTPANGTFAAPDKLVIGEYEIEVSYINDLGEKCEIKGKLTNDKNESEFGTLTVSAKGADNFKCPMCPTYEKFKPVPIVGWFIAFVHLFVHMAAHVGHLD